MLRKMLPKLISGEDLSSDEAEESMRVIMSGEATAAQIGAYLVALRIKGETVNEITGSAAAMRSVVKRVPVPDPENLIDTAGTGGDGSHSFNISTAAAFVIAGAGKRVAKHGNRAASSRCGSADVLAELGINLELSPERVCDCIDEVGIGFMFAPMFHPAMRHAIGPRRELGHRTIFNILGPLTNPAGAKKQLLGVFDPRLTQPMAEVLANLGGTAAMVVHGPGGMDELSTSGTNRVSRTINGSVQTSELNALEFDLRPATAQDLAGGDPKENAQIMRKLLSGALSTPLVDVVLFNAAAGLSLETGDIAVGLVAAREALKSGAAEEKLLRLVKKSQELA